MVTAVTKSPFPTEAHAMAHRKMRAVKMVVDKITVAKITGVASHAETNNAATIAAVKAVVVTKVAAATTVAVRPVLATNAAGQLSPVANPESTANARATMVQSQLVLVGIRML